MLRNNFWKHKCTLSIHCKNLCLSKRTIRLFKFQYLSFA